MKNKYVFVLVLLLSIMVISFGFTNIYVSHHQTVEDEDFVVVTSFYPMYIAGMNVVGDIDGVTLKNLSEPQTGCLHDFQLTPADMKLLSTADVFIINGGGIESFIEEIAVQYPDLKLIEASEGIEFLCEEDAHGHETHNEEAHDLYHEEDTEHVHDDNEHIEDTEHVHDDNEHVEDIEHVHDDNEHMEDAHNHDVNAHAWMSVELYRTQVENIAKKLAEIDPEHAESYLANAGIYDRKLEELQVEQEEVKVLTEGKNTIMFHCAFDYVAMEYGMDVAFCMDLDEERQVSAGEVASVLKVIDDEAVKYLFAEELYGASMCELVQKEADVKVIYLDPLNRGEYDADSYIRAMRNNIKLIRDAFTNGN